jgi:flagellin
MGLGKISGADLGPLTIRRAFDELSKSAKSTASGRKADNRGAHAIIAGQLRADVAVNQQGVRNANDGISMLQTFDAAAGTISSNLTKMAKLAMQAGTGTFSSRQKSIMEAEFNELGAEISRAADNTRFNGNNLSGGDGVVVSVALGTGTDIDIESADLTFDTSGLDLSADADSAMKAVEDRTEQVNKYRGYLGAKMNRLSAAVGVMETGIENAIAVESNISDTDTAREAAGHATSRIRAESALAMQAHMNAIRGTIAEVLTQEG